jgi:hypothetical protein
LSSPPAATWPGSAPARWRRSPALIVTVVALIYALVVTGPLVFQLDRSIYGTPGDATGTVAVYSWWNYALHHGQSIFDNTQWGAPFGAGWQSVPFAVIPVVLFAPLSALIGGTAAYNVEVLSSFPLTAWVTFLLARRVGCKPLGAAFAALAFTFVPYHLEKAQGHAGQTHMEFFSATLLFLVRWRQGGSRWNLVAAGAMAGLTLWDDYYFAYILAFAVATFFIVSFIFRPRETSQTAWLRRHLSSALAVALVAAIFVPATVLVALRPSNGSLSASLSAQSAGFNQGLNEIRVYTARPWEYFLPFHANPLLPAAVLKYEIDHLHGSNFTEESLFIGYTVLVLGTIGVIVGRRRFETALLLAMGFVGFLVALPPGIHLGPVTIPTPSLMLNPVFSIFRVYSRFGILVLLGSALLAGLGLTWLQGRLAGRRAWLVAVPFLLAAVEFNNLPPTHDTQLYPAPAEYQWLAQQPAGILVEYPLDAGTPQTEEIETRQYTLYQHVHGHPIFNGATTASRAYALYPTLEPYYGAGVAQTLKDIGIRYVFVHRAGYQQAGLNMPQSVAGLTYVETVDGVDIYVVGG